MKTSRGDRIPLNAAPSRDGVVRTATMSRAAVVIGESAVSTGERPGILCRVNATSRGIKAFQRVCFTQGIAVRPAGSTGFAFVPEHHSAVRDVFGESNGWFECVGTVDALATLEVCGAVEESGLLLKTAYGVDCRASGASKKK